MPENFEEWTTEELLDQVRHLLPKGQALGLDEGPNSWEVRVLQENEDEEPSVLWSGTGLTSRDALFKAFHHLWLPRQALSGVWSNDTARPSLRAVAQKISEKYADPPDLDPEVVASVYSPDQDPKEKI